MAEIGSYRSSRPDHWTVPRPHSDASQRLQKHGPIQPLPAESKDWFHPIIRALMILTTAATIIFIYRGGFS